MFNYERHLLLFLMHTFLDIDILLLEKSDWGPQIDVVGFCFLNLSQDYKPPESLVNFFAAGPPPIYVGFGSLVLF